MPSSSPVTVQEWTTGRATGPGAGAPGGTWDAVRKPGGPGAGAASAPQMVRIFPSLGNMFLRSPTTVTIYGFLPVVPMVLGSAIWMIFVSLMTRPPSKETIDKYFSPTAGCSPEPKPEKALV